jgi:hypothetical protein
MKDILRPFVPEYKGHLTTDDGDRILYDINETRIRASPTAEIGSVYDYYRYSRCDNNCIALRTRPPRTYITR